MNHCEKCIIDYEYKDKIDCNNGECPCHVLSESDWEVRLKEVLDYAVGLTAASKTLRLALKLFIAELLVETRAQAKAEGYREGHKHGEGLQAMAHQAN